VTDRFVAVERDVVVAERAAAAAALDEEQDLQETDY